MEAIGGVDRMGALAGLALGAARTVVVVEIGAAGTLEDVAAHGRHVADLSRCSSDDRARQHRIARSDRTVLGYCRVPRGSADKQPAVLSPLDCARQTSDVHERRW